LLSRAETHCWCDGVLVHHHLFSTLHQSQSSPQISNTATQPKLVTPPPSVYSARISRRR
jgi:hypothetical protein